MNTVGRAYMTRNNKMFTLHSYNFWTFSTYDYVTLFLCLFLYKKVKKPTLGSDYVAWNANLLNGRDSSQADPTAKLFLDLEGATYVFLNISPAVQTSKCVICCCKLGQISPKLLYNMFTAGKFESNMSLL